MFLGSWERSFFSVKWSEWIIPMLQMGRLSLRGLRDKFWPQPLSAPPWGSLRILASQAGLTWFPLLGHHPLLWRNADPSDLTPSALLFMFIYWFLGVRDDNIQFTIFTIFVCRGSVALNTFTLIHLPPEHSHLPKLKLSTYENRNSPISALPSRWQPLFYFLSLWIWLFEVTHISRII